MSDEKLTHSYLKIVGDAEFSALSCELALGSDCAALKEKRVAHVQALSGTGALRLLSNFLASQFPGIKILKSNPTWGNHKKIFAKAGLEQGDYRYWDAENRCLDIDGMLEDIAAALERSAVLLHCCAHNPTGVDPTEAQWAKICEVVKARGHIALFDSAYQGYATGDPEADAFSVRYFVKEGVSCVLAQSFSKNMGLYGERVGCASVVCASSEEVIVIQSQLAAIIRPMYSNPAPRSCRGETDPGNAEKSARWKVN